MRSLVSHRLQQFAVGEEDLCTRYGGVLVENVRKGIGMGGK